MSSQLNWAKAEEIKPNLSLKAKEATEPMKLVTSQGTVQLEESEMITFTADDGLALVELEISGPSIQIAVYDPLPVETKIMIFTNLPR